MQTVVNADISLVLFICAPLETDLIFLYALSIVASVAYLHFAICVTFFYFVRCISRKSVIKYFLLFVCLENFPYYEKKRLIKGLNFFSRA